uniref:Integrase catalytic domain-containing protein n=1 Tax=Tanacetum cinerariifolium TaxID=118510 RepID=A0A6L2KFJ2_TANCI|nr:hypothetical protein [Tanacetum cinerariifolium]
MVSYVKLPILKKGKYILWTMKMEQYLAHIDYALWEVILNGNSVVLMTKDEADEHFARFYAINDAKTLWAAIKTRFGGNVESKKMQKNILKQQFENFSVSNSEGLDKGYDRFQRLLSLLEIHKAGVSTEDANQKFLRSPPLAWSNISLIIRNKPNIYNLDTDDLYNNLKVYKVDIKGSSGSSLNSQNVDFISAESTSITNELNTAYSLDKEDLEQIDQDDLEEIDLKWDCRSAKNLGNMSRDDGNAGYRGRDNGKRPAKEEGEQALREKLSKANIEIIGYQYDIELIEGQLRVHQQNKVIYEEKIKVLEYQVKDKRYDSQFNEKEVLDIKEKEVTETVFDNRSSNEENSVANDKFKKGEGYHAVPPFLTRNFMPLKHDLSFGGLDDSIYKFKISETVPSLAKDEKDDIETSTACVEKPKEDRSSALLIKDWETDSDDDSVFTPKTILAKIDFLKAGESIKSVKHVKPVESVKPIESVKHVKPVTHTMAKKSVLPTNVGKRTGHRESRPIWNTVQRINHQKNFAPTAVFTRSGRIPVSVAKPKAATSTSAAKPVNITGPKQSVNFSRTRSTFHKSHSPIRRSFYNATAHIQEEIQLKELILLGQKQLVLLRKMRHMIRNKAYLADYQEIHDGGFVAFGSSRDKITSKGKIRTKNLDFDDVYFVNELKFNLFHVSQMCDKKNSVLFTETKCLVLSPIFKLLDESQVLLRVPRQSNMRLGHVNFKTMNKLVKGNLVRGLLLKIFNNDHSCVACQKGKQHKATCKAKLVSLISQPLQILHMDLFGLTSVMSINHKKYCLVVTGDFSRFSWVFFLATKDETSKVLKPFISAIENQINNKVKVIRCDNGTDFQNRVIDEFSGMKGIKREYSNARTLQQNGVTERKNRTLFKAARTMLADSLLPITFWAEAANTACYVLNRALVTKTHNKTPYELLNGRSPILDFMRTFSCPVTILNTLDPLEKFKGKADEGFLVRKKVSDQHYIVLPLWSSISSTYKSSDDKPADDKPKDDIGSKIVEESVNKEDQAYRNELDRLMSQEKEASDAADALRKDNPLNAASTSGTFSASGPSSAHPDAFIPANTLQHVKAMQEELLQFSLQKVWRLFDLPYEKKAIETKWVYTNKKDERGIVVRNKSRLEAQRHKQEEGIDYDDVFAPVARIEAIRIFLAFASFMEFIVCQMDVKSAFLYGIIEEEVYVSQPLGFIDPQFPNKVYKVEKALYGLHQAPRAWYESLSTFLLQNRHRRVKQSEEGIFISQDKYVAEILKKFYFSSIKTTSTPIETQKPLVKDKVAIDVTQKLSHLQAVKKIFRYLKGQPKLGLWYPRDYPFDLKPYSDTDYAGANLDRKSTIGGCQFLGRRLISWQCKKQTIVATSTTEAEYVATANCTLSSINLYMADLKFVDQHNMVACLENTEENPEEFHQIMDFISICSINYALTVSLTIYASYIEQFWNIAISKTVNSVKQIHVIVDGKVVVISESSVRSGLLFNDEDGNRPMCQETTLGGKDAQNRFETASKRSSDPPLLTGHTVRSGEHKMEQETNLTNFVPPTPYDSPLSGGHTPGSDEGRNDDLTEELNLGSGDKGGSTAETISTARPDISVARPEVSAAEPKTPPTTTTLFDDEDVTIVDTLVKMKSQIAKEKGVAFKDADDSARPIKSITTLQPLPTIDSKDKELDRAQKERQKQEEATIAALTEEFDEIQAKIDVDHELVVRMTHEEQEMYTIKERARLLVEYFERRKKQLAAERAEAIRNKPPTRTFAIDDEIWYSVVSLRMNQLR